MALPIPATYREALRRKWRDLLENPLPAAYWSREDFISPAFDVNNKVEGIKIINAQIRNLSKDSDFLEVYLHNYINEIWISEIPPSKELETLELVEHVRNNDKESFLKDLSKSAYGTEEEQLKLWKQLSNLNEACNQLFRPSEDPHRELSVELAKEVHGIVGKDVINNAGEYRKRQVTASGSSVTYAPCHSIESRLVFLIEFTNSEMKEDVKEMLYLGAFFFSEFLLIHPFEDGNGRTARLLLSHLLRKVTTVPISLHLQTRELYLNVLEDRNDQSRPPSLLTTFVVLCASKVATDSHWYLLG